MAVDYRMNIGARLINLAVNEALEKTRAAVRVDCIAVEIVLDDVGGRHQRGRYRARHQIAVRRTGMAQRDVAKTVDHALRGEYAARRGEVRDEFGRDRAGGVVRHEFPWGFSVRAHNSRIDWRARHAAGCVRKSPAKIIDGSTQVEKVLAAVRTGPSKTEIREFPMPDIAGDAALMKMEVAGICGTDVKLYAHPPSAAPGIMGPENIGTIAKAGREFTRRKGFREGDLVFVEHYVMCGKCEWCHLGQYRHCENTDWRNNPDGIRYGYTSAEKAPHLWGGFAQYVYLPWNSVVHRVPKNVTPELAGLVTPMGNGVEGSLFDGGVGYDSSVLIQGPGQQGLSQTVICKQAGAALIIVTGTSKDAARMEVAKQLGADFVIDVNKEDPLARIMEITGGRGVDVVLDCTAGAGTFPILLGIEALKRKGGTLVVQGEMGDFPNFPVGQITGKFINL